jgi:glycosyltransferase involved in cell wall biosynthesis
MLRVCLLTRGSPAAVTGGHLYQRRMSEEARRHDATVEFAQASMWKRLPRRADVIAIDSIAAWRLAGPLLGRRGGPPLVAIVHQPPGGVDGSRPRRRAQGALDRFVYRRCVATIVAGTTVADELVGVDGLDPSRVFVVEPGCDLPVASAAPELRHGRRLAVVSVANWYPNKGLLELLDAVAELAADDVTVHLAGREDVDPAYTRQVRARLAAPDLGGRVVVHGPLDRDGVAGLYAGADAFVLPSYRETYSTVLAEAAAAGLPIVAWRAPHAERVVTDGEEGLLVPVGDRDALAGALRALAADVELRSRLAASARRRGAVLPRWADSATAFFRVLRGAAHDTVAGAE